MLIHKKGRYQLRKTMKHTYKFWWVLKWNSLKVQPLAGDLSFAYYSVDCSENRWEHSKHLLCPSLEGWILSSKLPPGWCNTSHPTVGKSRKTHTDFIGGDVYLFEQYNVKKTCYMSIYIYIFIYIHTPTQKTNQEIKILAQLPTWSKISPTPRCCSAAVEEPAVTKLIFHGTFCLKKMTWFFCWSDLWF